MRSLLLTTSALRAVVLFGIVARSTCENIDSEEDGKEAAAVRKEARAELSDDQLRQVHAEFDVNGDKEATKQELMRFVEGHQREVEQAEAGVDVGEMMKERDTSKDGLISLEEHLNGEVSELERVYGKTSTEANAARADETERFHAADANGDGLLNSKEHLAIIHPATSESMLKVEIKQRVRDTDTDHDGRLSFQEFQEGGFASKHVEKVLDSEAGEESGAESDAGEQAAGEGAEEHDQQKAEVASKKLFKRLDKNGDGSIDHEELIPLESGKIQQEDAVHGLVQAMDKDGDTHIDADELVQGKSTLKDSEIQNYLIAWAQRRQVVGSAR